ncbi:MAG: DUF6798 domain-containing protein [Aureliella sp.]
MTARAKRRAEAAEHRDAQSPDAPERESHRLAAGDEATGRSSGYGAMLAAVWLNFLIIWLLDASLVPGVNESHYLPKAKHAWNPEYAPGDLFLASGNAHWLFSEIAGFLSTFLSLTAVAWVGRVVSWLAMAFAWQRLARSLRFSIPVSALVLAGWILATRLGNWAGEWAIGGFEAKSLAYPFVILALARLLDGRWNKVWLPIGVAIAFHPLVGGWAGLTMVGAWLLWGRKIAPLGEQVWPALVAGAIALVGILPALSMIGGPARAGDIVVAQIHAFFRLAHHQSPHLFAGSQHIAGACTLILFVIATALVYAPWRAGRGLNEVSAVARGEGDPAAMLVAVAWLSVAISLIGLLIDWIGVRTRPDIAAGLLRFYWFRWSDVAVPLAWVVGMWSCALRVCRPTAVSAAMPSRRPLGSSQQFHWALGALPATLLVLFTVAAMGRQVMEQWEDELAPADRTLLMSESPELASGPEVVRDWQAVCDWVAENTPTDALFLTPRAQQTFKWYAGRAEVVCYKDVPQDSRSLLEWYDRLVHCAPPRGPGGEPLGWTTSQLRALQARYHFQYVLVDRRIQREPPLLEIVYPNSSIANGTYAVFKFSDVPAAAH